MIQLVKKLLAGRPNPHVAALEKALEANKADYAIAASFRSEMDTYQAKLKELKLDPENKELAAECIAVGARAFAEGQARAEVSVILGQNINFKVEQRTRAALRPALEAIKDRLIDELASVERQDQLAAEKYGIAPKDGPVAQELKSALETVAGFLGQVDAATIGTLPIMVSFAMNESK